MSGKLLTDLINIFVLQKPVKFSGNLVQSKLFSLSLSLSLSLSFSLSLSLSLSVSLSLCKLTLNWIVHLAKLHKTTSELPEEKNENEFSVFRIQKLASDLLKFYKNSIEF